MGGRYLEALKKHETVVARNVTANLFERHTKPSGWANSNGDLEARGCI